MSRKKKIVCGVGIGILVVAGIIICLFLNGNSSQAAGLLDETLNAENLYSKYALDNYQLDFYVDTSGGWLPWNWGDSIGKGVMYGLYCFTNILWSFNTSISSATGYALQEAYNLNFIGDVANSLGMNIQTLAGVSSSGFSTDGLYVKFLPWIIVVVGGYTAYYGLIKREVSKALQGFLNFLIVFVASAAIIACAPDYISAINEFSTDTSNVMLDVGMKITLPGNESQDEDGTDRLRNSLFSIQVYQPWLLLQYGTTDVDTIGTERIENLLSVSPSEGEQREEQVKKEVEEYGNINMSLTKVSSRFGMALFLLLFNIGISTFVFLLTGIMLLSQILFIIFGIFLPTSFLISMLPSQQGTWKTAVMKLFNVILNRAGITLVVTGTFCISSMLYEATAGYPFFLIMFLQVITFVGVYTQLGEILGMFNLRNNGEESIGRKIFRHPYRYARRGTRYVKDKVKRMVGAGMIGMGVKAKSNKANVQNRGSRTMEINARERTRPDVGKVENIAGKIADTPAKTFDKAKRPFEKIADLSTNTKYAVHSVGKEFKHELDDGKVNRANRQLQRREDKEFKRSEVAQAAEQRQEKRKERMKKRESVPLHIPMEKSHVEKEKGNKWNDLGRIPKTVALNQRPDEVRVNKKGSNDKENIPLQTQSDVGEKNRVRSGKLKNRMERKNFPVYTTRYTPRIKGNSGIQKAASKGKNEKRITEEKKGNRK